MRAAKKHSGLVDVRTAGNVWTDFAEPPVLVCHTVCIPLYQELSVYFPRTAL